MQKWGQRIQKARSDRAGSAILDHAGDHGAVPDRSHRQLAIFRATWNVDVSIFRVGCRL